MERETRVGRKKSRIIQNVSIPGRRWAAVTKATFPVPRMVRGFIGTQEAEPRKEGVSQGMVHTPSDGNCSPAAGVQMSEG